MAAPMASTTTTSEMNGSADFPKISHVIFDMDGLLLDTETLYTKATQRVLDEYGGKTYTWEVKSKCMGHKLDEAAQIMIDAYDLPLTPEQYMEKGLEQYKIIFPTAELMPGVKKLVTHLHKHNVPMAVATGASTENFELETMHHKKLFALFDHVVLLSSDPEVAKGKPAPDGFLVCASRFKDKPKPEQVLVFEDADNGVMAATNAGMSVVWIPGPQSQSDRSEYDNVASLTLDSMADFKPELFGLPPYDS
ncbi:pseudouridine-5'-phosphatase-like [Tubulanus polymorphus]|uniref:pseudouridine-5'-phosphatase-like n=1 Tax=Tubulanus polymorphus TaxID=672921 RepID=UPI003DA20BF2